MRLLLVPLASLALLASTAHAETIACTGDNYVGVDRARYTCDIENVRRGEVVTLPRNRSCDRPRYFIAESSNRRVGAYAIRNVPQRTFLLKSESDDDGQLLVRVYVNRKRIKFINRSDFKVDLSYSQRCKL